MQKEREFSFSKRARIGALMISTLLLVEPILPSVSYAKEKVFKNQMNNSIRVERMGDKMASAQKTVDKMTAEVKSDINSFLKGELDYFTIIIKRQNSSEYDRQFSDEYKKLNKSDKSKFDKKVSVVLSNTVLNKPQIKNELDNLFQSFVNSKGNQVFDNWIALKTNIEKYGSNIEDLIIFAYSNYKDNKSMMKSFFENLKVATESEMKQFNDVAKEKLDIEKGIWDNENERKISEFQKENNLNQTGFIDKATFDKISSIKIAKDLTNKNIDTLRIYVNGSSTKIEDFPSSGHFDAIVEMTYKDGQRVLVGVNYNKSGDHSYSYEFLTKEWEDKKARKRIEIETQDILDKLFGGEESYIRPSYFRYYSNSGDNLLMWGIDARTANYYWINSERQQNGSRLISFQGDPNYMRFELQRHLNNPKADPRYLEYYQALLGQDVIINKLGIPTTLGQIKNTNVYITIAGKTTSLTYNGGTVWINKELGYKVSNINIETTNDGNLNAVVWVSFVTKEKDKSGKEAEKVLKTEKVNINTPTEFGIKADYGDQEIKRLLGGLTFNMEVRPPKEVIDEAVNNFMKNSANTVELDIGGNKIPISFGVSFPYTVTTRDSKGNTVTITLNGFKTGVVFNSQIDLQAELNINVIDNKGNVLDYKSITLRNNEMQRLPLANLETPIKMSILNTGSSFNNVNFIDSSIQLTTIRVVNRDKEPQYITNATYITSLNGEKTITANVNYLTREPVQVKSGIFNLTDEGKVTEIEAKTYKEFVKKWEEERQQEATSTMRAALGESTIIGGLFDFRNNDGTGLTLYLHDGTPLINNKIASSENLNYKLDWITKGFRVIDGLKIKGITAEKKEELAEKAELETERRLYTRRETGGGVVGEMDYSIEKILNMKGVFKFVGKNIEDWDYRITNYLTGKQKEFQYQSVDPSGTGLTMNSLNYRAEKLAGENRLGEVSNESNYFRTDISYNTGQINKFNIKPGVVIGKEDKKNIYKKREPTYKLNDFLDYTSKYFRPYAILNMGNLSLNLARGEKKETNKYEYIIKSPEGSILGLITYFNERTMKGLHVGFELARQSIFGKSATIMGYYNQEESDSVSKINNAWNNSYSQKNTIFFVQPTVEFNKDIMAGVGITYRLNENEQKSLYDWQKGKDTALDINLDVKKKNKFAITYIFGLTDYSFQGSSAKENFNQIRNKLSGTLFGKDKEGSFSIENVRTNKGYNSWNTWLTFTIKY